ncbi:TetR-like C-terminal domain-containing protein [Microbacterium sp. Nx66]|uniref:TetR-like C-terminal domain-containing protein n=1 Tax=Microbacterium sp. Nx66 TaxID=2766784 RepID=UPI0018D83CE1
MAEAEREPGLLEQMRAQGNQPRCQELTDVLQDLQQRGAVRADIDVDTIVSLCFGSYFADFNRFGGDVPADLPERVASALWPAIAAFRIQRRWNPRLVSYRRDSSMSCATDRPNDAVIPVSVDMRGFDGAVESFALLERPTSMSWSWFLVMPTRLASIS